jgi:hypothetical protein
MTSPTSQRSLVRDAIVSYLQNAELLPDLAALTPAGHAAASAIVGWQTGDVTRLSDAMVAALGIVVLVIVSSGREAGGQEIQPTLDAPVTIMITELVETNRSPAGSGLPGDYVAEQILAALKYWQVPATEYIVIPAQNAEAIADGTPMRNLFSKDAETGYFTQIVNLETRVAVSPRPQA